MKNFIWLLLATGCIQEYDIRKDIEPPVAPDVVETDVPKDPVLPVETRRTICYDFG